MVKQFSGYYQQKENKSYYLNEKVFLEDISEIKVSFLKIYDKEETSPKNKSNKNIFYGAAAVILIAMYLIGYFYFNQGEKKVIAVNKNKTAVDSSLEQRNKKANSNKNNTQNIKENFIAANKLNEKDFEENTVLENFINRNVRSEKSVEIISPNINDTLKNKFLLKWTSDIKGEKYKIIIVNNRNEKVWENATSYNTILWLIKNCNLAFITGKLKRKIL